jgi:hypothetical protein
MGTGHLTKAESASLLANIRRTAAVIDLGVRRISGQISSGGQAMTSIALSMHNPSGTRNAFVPEGQATSPGADSAAHRGRDGTGAMARGEGVQCAPRERIRSRARLGH